MKDYELHDDAYFKIYLKKDCIYKISVHCLEEGNNGNGSETRYYYDYHDKKDDSTYFCAELKSDSDSWEYNAKISDKEKDSVYLFKAGYSGYYYLQVNDYLYDDVRFSFKFDYYNPINKIGSDSEGNKYKIISNSQVEIIKYANLKTRYYGIHDSVLLNNVDGIESVEVGKEGSFTFDVVSIGDYAFKGCKLVYVEIPGTVKKIGVGAFQNCKRLGYREKYGVEISSKNIIIEKNAFNGCKKLKGIRFRSKASIKSIKKNAFKGTKKGIKIYAGNVKKIKKKLKKAGLNKPQYIRLRDWQS